MKTHIIGAGPTGLTLATHLTGEIHVYEKESKVGGCHAIFYTPFYTEHSPKMYNTSYVRTLELLKDVMDIKDTPDATDNTQYYKEVDTELLYLYSRYSLGLLSSKKKLSKTHRLKFQNLLTLIESVSTKEWTYHSFFKIFTYNYNAKTFTPTNDFCNKWRQKLESRPKTHFHTNMNISLAVPDLYTQLYNYRKGDKIYFCGPLDQMYRSLGKEIPSKFVSKVYRPKKAYTLIYKKTPEFQSIKEWYKLKNAKNYGIVFLEKSQKDMDKYLLLSVICINHDYSPFTISNILKKDGLPPLYSFKELPLGTYSGNSNFGENVPTDYGHFTYLNHCNGLSDYPFNTIESSIQNVEKFLCLQNVKLQNL